MNAETTATQIRDQIQEVMAVIEHSNASMNAGDSVDLRNLERLVSELHQAVARHPADGAGMSAGKLIDSFTSILTGLDNLEANLNANQARTVGVVNGNKK